MRKEEINEIEQEIIEEENKRQQKLSLKKSLVSIGLIAIVSLWGIGGYRQISKSNPKSNLFYSKPPTQEQWENLINYGDLNDEGFDDLAEELDRISSNKKFNTLLNSKILRDVVFVLNGNEYRLVTSIDSDEEVVTLFQQPIGKSEGENIMVDSTPIDQIKNKPPHVIFMRFALSLALADFQKTNEGLYVGSVGGDRVQEGILGLYTEKGGELITTYGMRLDGKKIYLKETGRR